MIVQKYGGTSVGTPEKIKQVARKIGLARAQGEDVVVVVSAIGDTTDELLRLAREVSPVTHEREMDVLLSAGERISMALLSMALRDIGCEAISFTGSQAGIITDESHTRARIVEIRPVRVREELARGKVVIVAGFQGVSRNKEITTLGRGGSDTTAVAMATTLAAHRCEVYTDVAGIYSADPRVVPEAHLYNELPAELVFEMATLGAQVMHPRSIEIAREKGFPIFVGMAHGDGGKGTTILAEGKALQLPRVTAVVHRKGMASLRFSEPQGREIVSELARQSVSIHNCRVEPDGQLSFKVEADDCGALLENHKQAVEPARFAQVSLVGRRLEDHAEIPARVATVLEAHSIALAGLTCQSQSITVWLREHARAEQSLDETLTRAVRALHKEFIARKS